MSDEDELALAVFDEGLEALPETAEFRHKDAGLFTSTEAQQLDDIRNLVESYLARADAVRPLSFAVFGAPGSGKSRLVKRLPELLGETGKQLGRLTEINLTQVTSVDDLAAAVVHAGTAGEGVPFVFFDEFDSTFAGAPLGWLGWFLAPMQDGVVRSAGTDVSVKRALFVFAGGTATSFESFNAPGREAFAAAKGPDFVSRLRGYVDIPGVNADVRPRIRRAAVAGFYLRAQGKTVDSELRDALLHVGRYKHGARSVEAMVELMPRKDAVSIDDICDHRLLEMHVDRGALDPEMIGGCIGMSAGLKGDAPGLLEAWHRLIRLLFSEGATIAYGGNWSEQGLTAQLEQVVKLLPRRLESAARTRILATSRSDGAQAVAAVEHLAPSIVVDDEVPADLEGETRKIWEQALGMFRMRFQLGLRSVGQVAIGGLLDTPELAPPRRIPGVVEELMLAVGMKHPVYIVGAFGGGAMWAGTLLGLGRDWRGVVPGWDHSAVTIPGTHANKFRPPALDDLPLTRDEVVAFLRDRALGGPNWVDNGLSAEENRELFETTDVEKLARLLRRGLRTRFARRRS